MKYSICSRLPGSPDTVSGHLTAASALENLTALKAGGTHQIEVFDFKTGRLVDEAALIRVDAAERLLAARRPVGAGSA